MERSERDVMDCKVTKHTVSNRVNLAVCQNGNVVALTSVLCHCYQSERGNRRHASPVLSVANPVRRQHNGRLMSFDSWLH